MTLERFADDPWKTSHKAYEGSTFNIRPAPEFATAEVLVASLYRAIGYEGYSESSVPAAGRAFDKASQQAKRSRPAGSGIGVDTWRTILHQVLESPKQPNQSSKRFLQLSPVVPDVAIYSGSARLSGNSWNPGLLINRMVLLGSESEKSANELWSQLFAALSVGDSDDVWARWLQQEFERRRDPSFKWSLQALDIGSDLPAAEKRELKYPARQFARDLEAIILAKDCMTRRQWISLLEAVLRLSAATHVLWLCDVNDRLWHKARAILNGEPCPTEADVRAQIVSCESPYLAYGNPAVQVIRDYACRYLGARLGLNLLLWNLKEAAGFEVDSMSSCMDLYAFLSAVHTHRDILSGADVFGQNSALQDKEARTLACKKGIGSNLVEFGRHALGQRQTANESLRGYDQGYFLRKKGEHASAPWIVSLGPVAVLALVHCCLREAAGPRSVQQLCQHLAWYGIRVERNDIANSDLGRQLRMLGLVLDSPDAESGMLLVPPFESAPAAGGVHGS